MELHSWNRNGELHLLHLETDRIRRLGDRGWDQLRLSSRGRNTRSHCNRRYNRFQPVQGDRVRLISNLEHKRFLAVSEFLVLTSVEMSQHRFRGIVSNKNILRRQERTRKKLRLRNPIVTRRARKPETALLTCWR